MISSEEGSAGRFDVASGFVLGLGGRREAEEVVGGADEEELDEVDGAGDTEDRNLTKGPV